MSLRKDDPVYYKIKLQELISQVEQNGLYVRCYKENNKVRISFEENEHNIASVSLWLENNK